MFAHVLMPREIPVRPETQDFQERQGEGIVGCVKIT